jgi:hypothetical protein
MKADGKTKASDSMTTSKDLKTPTAETKPSTSDSKTTGNAATSATAAPPAEKRTQITSAIKQEKVEEVTNVNFNVSVGTTVPAIVRCRHVSWKSIRNGVDTISSLCTASTSFFAPAPTRSST